MSHKAGDPLSSHGTQHCSMQRPRSRRQGSEFRQALGGPAQACPALQQVTQQSSQDCCKQPAFPPLSLPISQKISANSTRESSLKEIIHMHIIFKETFGQKNWTAASRKSRDLAGMEFPSPGSGGYGMEAFLSHGNTQSPELPKAKPPLNS